MLGLSDALGTPTTGNSLDNTIRIVERAPTEWVMLDVRIDATVHGYAHAGAHLWTDDGVLLGMATQTLVVREPGSTGSRPAPRAASSATPDAPLRSAAHAAFPSYAVALGASREQVGSLTAAVGSFTPLLDTYRMTASVGTTVAELRATSYARCIDTDPT